MSNRDDRQDAQVTTDMKQRFDESVDALDAETLSRLNRGRQKALQELNGHSPRWLQWMPATGLAAAALIAAVMFTGPGDVDVIAAPASDFEIVMSEEDIDMLEELEFYSWLATQELEGNGDLG